jgi:hypothetical protein
VDLGYLGIRILFSDAWNSHLWTSWRLWQEIPYETIDHVNLHIISEITERLIMEIKIINNGTPNFQIFCFRHQFPKLCVVISISYWFMCHCVVVCNLYWYFGPPHYACCGLWVAVSLISLLVFSVSHLGFFWLLVFRGVCGCACALVCM